jgi:hypothetical protein
MWDRDREPVRGANTPWYLALDHPGAAQMKHVRRLFESRPFERLRPNTEFIKDGSTTGGGKIRAGLADDGSFAFVYPPRGEQFTIDLSVFAGTKVRGAWFDPRYGVSHEPHTSDRFGIQTFVSPTSGHGQDWVLILRRMAISNDSSRDGPQSGLPLDSRKPKTKTDPGEAF